jgi:hypothetical protein
LNAADARATGGPHLRFQYDGFANFRRRLKDFVRSFTHAPGGRRDFGVSQKFFALVFVESGHLELLVLV